MDAVFESFRSAFENANGYELSQTISPVALASDPNRLYNFSRSTNIAQVQRDFKQHILYSRLSQFSLSAEEGNGWVEVYFTYWKAVNEILKAEEDNRSGNKVGNT